MIQALPLQYLQLESGILPLFLVMVLMTQFARVAGPGRYVGGGQSQLLWLSTGFGLMTVLFGSLLLKTSPPMGIELAAGCILSLLHPANALCFFVHLLFLRPWEIATNNFLLLLLPRFLALLCIFSWLIHPRQHGKPTNEALRGLTIVLSFSAWLFLTTFFTPHVSESQVDWFGSYFKSLIVLVMCLFFIDGERSVSEFQWALVISALALMAVGFYQFRTGTTDSSRLESIGMFGDPNDLAAIIVIALPLALIPAFSKEAGLGARLLGLLFGGFSLLVIWDSQSRGAMLAVAVQILAAAYMKGFRQKNIGLVFLIGLLGAGYFVALKAIPRESGEMEASSESRITYWKAAVNMTVHHPLFGVGYDQYPDNYEGYSSGTRYEWGKRTAHSSWLLAFAESGIIGGVLYIVFFLSVLRMAWRNHVQRPEQLCALVGYGVVMSFLSHTYSLYMFLLAGLIYASDSLVPRTNE